MKKNIAVNIQLIKDIIHAVLPILLLYVLPHGWGTLAIVYAYFLLKAYVYFFIKNNVSDIAIASVLIDAFIIAGYVNGL